jgi:ADP-ribosylation factor protein 1
MFPNNSITDAKILICGLDACGKASIMYKMAGNKEVVTEIPTIGMNLKSLTLNEVKFTSWTVGGRDRIRPLYKHWFNGADAFIFVVDSADAERFPYAREELERLLSDDLLQDAIVLIFANKKDLPGARSISEMTEKLGLPQLRQNWFIQPSDAKTGDGLFEGIDWLTQSLGKRYLGPKT